MAFRFDFAKDEFDEAGGSPSEGPKSLVAEHSTVPKPELTKAEDDYAEVSLQELVSLLPVEVCSSSLDHSSPNISSRNSTAQLTAILLNQIRSQLCHQ